MADMNSPLNPLSVDLQIFQTFSFKLTFVSLLEIDFFLFKIKNLGRLWKTKCGKGIDISIFHNDIDMRSNISSYHLIDRYIGMKINIIYHYVVRGV